MLTRWRHSAEQFATAVKADYASVQANRKKYHQQEISSWRLPVDLLRKVGFQTVFGVRLMQAARDARLPLLPAVLSRLLRHAYGVEIHWDAQIAPGISLVHGNGLVISHAATVGSGCILFHNVTLGEGLDAKTRARGAPTLEDNVHIGPGATLLGPITVGEGSKIMAGAVLDQSVPKHSLVTPHKAQIAARASRAKAQASVVAEEDG
jgi:serine O-acetyltransferase